MNNYFKHFIYTTQAFTPEECNHQIQRFELDQQSQLHDYSEHHGVQWKNCNSIYITQHQHWSDIDRLYAQRCSQLLYEYIDHCERVLQDCIPKPPLFKSHTYHDTGFKLKRYDPGDYFHWHHDLTNKDPMGWRHVGCIFYLNDVHQGGETEFLDGTLIKPTQGTVLMFPSCWTYVHRGLSPVNQPKYAATTFFCSQ